ncbi:unnamed protein product [Owenia fusiformis]|uniref:Uncharacterized protein n=1 Tax=Owenia fusiformis TaxID=6347 RepID=A0A8J1U640_OWEFU|nr:unnamed protein product [Owenia fusiformis]
MYLHTSCRCYTNHQKAKPTQNRGTKTAKSRSSQTNKTLSAKKLHNRDFSAIQRSVQDFDEAFTRKEESDSFGSLRKASAKDVVVSKQSTLKDLENEVPSVKWKEVSTKDFQPKNITSTTKSITKASNAKPGGSRNDDFNNYIDSMSKKLQIKDDVIQRTNLQHPKARTRGVKITVPEDKDEDAYERKLVDCINSEKDEQDIAEIFGVLNEDIHKSMGESTGLDVEYKGKDTENMDEDPESRPYLRLSKYDRRHTQHYYLMKMFNAIRAKDLKKAISVLEVDMLEKDRVMPSRYHFTMLITACGKIGYMEKAFQLYNKMKEHGLMPSGPTYTSMFNACANSPYKDKALKQVRYLHNAMLEKSVEIHPTTFKAIMKSYAITGDMQAAFATMDDMKVKGHKLDTECFSFLLMACISDKEAGLKHAIEVWRAMRKRKLTPEGYQYNLLLRAARDCGLGTPEFANTLIKKISGKPQNATLQTPAMLTGMDGNQLLQITALNVEMETPTEHKENNESALETRVIKDDNTNSKPWWKVKKEKYEAEAIHKLLNSETALQAQPHVISGKMPNILNPSGKFRDVISLDRIETPQDRLMLLGGMSGFLSHMSVDGAKPDIKTFSQLLELIPSDTHIEKELLANMKQMQVHPDVDFLNLLIMKRNRRKDYKGAQEVFNRITSSKRLTPNIRTFGCLVTRTLDVVTLDNFIQLLKEYDMKPNLHIISNIIVGCGDNFQLLRKVLELMVEYNIQPHSGILRELEKKRAKGKQILLKKEQGEKMSAFLSSRQWDNAYEIYMLRYKSWLQQMDLHQSEDPFKYMKEDPLPPQQLNIDPDELLPDGHEVSFT